VSFAVGTLVGDVILHILPVLWGIHSHGSEDSSHDEHDHENEPTVSKEQWLGLTVCAGIIIFMLIELLIHYIHHLKGIEHKEFEMTEFDSSSASDEADSGKPQKQGSLPKMLNRIKSVAGINQKRRKYAEIKVN
jgi:hypothetical protein